MTMSIEDAAGGLRYPSARRDALFDGLLGIKDPLGRGMGLGLVW
jgi:hypothetical protein